MHLFVSEARCQVCKIAIALKEDDRMDASGPYYSSVIRIVRGLVHATIARLDSVNVFHAGLPSVAAETSGDGAISECNGVKETAPAYVH
jgi:hypothetical protein